MLPPTTACCPLAFLPVDGTGGYDKNSTNLGDSAVWLPARHCAPARNAGRAGTGQSIQNATDWRWKSRSPHSAVLPPTTARQFFTSHDERRQDSNAVSKVLRTKFHSRNDVELRLEIPLAARLTVETWPAKRCASSPNALQSTATCEYAAQEQLTLSRVNTSSSFSPAQSPPGQQSTRFQRRIRICSCPLHHQSRSKIRKRPPFAHFRVTTAHDLLITTNHRGNAHQGLAGLHLGLRSFLALGCSTFLYAPVFHRPPPLAAAQHHLNPSRCRSSRCGEAIAALCDSSAS